MDSPLRGSPLRGASKAGVLPCRCASGQSNHPVDIEGSNPASSVMKKGSQGPLFHDWRRERDSNPRYGITVYTLSRRAPSTTRPPLRKLYARSRSVHPAKQRRVNHHQANRNSRPETARAKQRAAARTWGLPPSVGVRWQSPREDMYVTARAHVSNSGSSDLFDLVDTDHGMQWHMEPLNPLELVPQAFLTGVNDHTGPLAEKKLLDGNEPVQLILVHLAGEDFVHLALVDEGYAKPGFLCHGNIMQANDRIASAWARREAASIRTNGLVAVHRSPGLGRAMREFHPQAPARNHQPVGPALSQVRASIHLPIAGGTSFCARPLT